MTDEQPHQQLEPVVPETDRPQEIIPIDQLPNRLGFIENEELDRLHRQIEEAVVLGDEAGAKELTTRYREQAEALTAQLQGEEYTRATIGVNVAIALIKRQRAMTENYIEDLEFARTSAQNNHYIDVDVALLVAIVEAETQADGLPPLTPEDIAKGVREYISRQG